MYRYKDEHTIARMAKVLKVSESGYYKWHKRQSQASLRDIENIEIERRILEIFYKSKGIFGIRKITKEINKTHPNPVNHKRVERIMKQNQIYSRVRKKYIVTTDSSQTKKVAENILQRDFNASKPLEKLVSDTTYIQTKEGTLYVAVILDLYAKMPIGLSMSSRNDTKLVIDCLKDVTTRMKLEKGCIIHSDRGSTYASKEYQDLIRQSNLTCSMSRKGDCWDNAPMESFFGKLKTEWITRKFKTKKEAMRSIYEYVWDFYPRQRPHASLNYETPIEYYSKAKS